MKPSHHSPSFSIFAGVSCVVCGLIPGSALQSTPSWFNELAEEIPITPLVMPSSDRVGRAKIIVRDSDSRPIPQAMVRALVEQDGIIKLASRGISTVDGVVQLEGLPIGSHWFIVEKTEKSRASIQRFVGPEPIDFEVRLGSERPFEISVFNDLGQPISNAEIEVRDSDRLPHGARTHTNGIAHVHGLTEGPLRVRVRAVGLDETEIPAATGSTLRVVLKKLGSLIISVVLPNGTPAVGATVSIAGGTLQVPRNTQTGNDGVARISGLHEGSYDVRASFGLYVSPVEIGTFLPQGSSSPVQLTLSQGRMLNVHVVDENKNGIPNAEVTATESGISPFPIQATTINNGLAKIGPVATHHVSITARATGFMSRGSVLVADQNSETEMTVVLRHGATILGRVNDSLGRPIDGAILEVIGTDVDGTPIDTSATTMSFASKLFARMSTARTLIPMGELGVVPGPVPPIPQGSIGFNSSSSFRDSDGISSWVSRDDGSFRITPVSPGRMRVFAHHPAYVHGVSDFLSLESNREASVTIVLASGGKLIGKVRDERGQTVSGAYIEVHSRSGNRVRRARSASDGSYEIAAVPSEAMVTVAWPNRPFEIALRQDVSIPDQTTKELDLLLPSALPTSQIRVFDERRIPVRAAQITLASLDPKRPMKTTVFTNDRGEANLPSSVGLHAEISVFASGYAMTQKVYDSIQQDIEIQMNKGLRVFGIVYDSNRYSRASNAFVSLIIHNGIVRTQTNSNGEFSWNDIPQGDATLEIRKPGSAHFQRTWSIVSSGSRAEFDMGRIELEIGGSIEGEVVDEKGSPVSHARVARDRVPSYITTSSIPQGVAVTDAKGLFKLEDLAVGDAVFEAYSDEFGRGRSSSIPIESGRTTSSVRIVLHTSENSQNSSVHLTSGVAITLMQTNAESPVVVYSVAPDSEAERAGLRKDDELLSIDRQPIRTLQEARTQLNGPVGVDVIVQIRRNGAEKTVRVTREEIRK